MGCRWVEIILKFVKAQLDQSLVHVVSSSHLHSSYGVTCQCILGAGFALQLINAALVRHRPCYWVYKTLRFQSPVWRKKCLLNVKLAKVDQMSETGCGFLPLQAVLKTLLQPMSKAIQQVQTFREANRTSPLFNHLSAVSESAPALGWVAMVRREGEDFWDCGLCVTESGSVCGQINECNGPETGLFDSVITVWWTTVSWLTTATELCLLFWCTQWMHSFCVRLLKFVEDLDINIALICYCSRQFRGITPHFWK